MSQTEVTRALGQPPKSRRGATWSFERPFKLIVQFSGGSVARITTWDPRARTSSGLGLGVSEAQVVSALGVTSNSYPVQGGVWLHNNMIGLAVFVRDGIAAAFMVLEPAATGVQSPVPAPPSTAPPTTVPPTSSQQIPVGPSILIEDVKHSVDGTVTVEGNVHNVGPVPRTGVSVAVVAKAFRGYVEEKSTEVASYLVPSATAPFRLDLGRDLWSAYTVRVDHYAPLQTHERLASVSRKIPKVDYINWQSGDMRNFVSAYGSGGFVRRIGDFSWATDVRVSMSDRLPRYARLVSVVVEVRYTIYTSRRSLNQEAQVALSPGSSVATIPVTLGEPFQVGAIMARVVAVSWTLNW